MNSRLSFCAGVGNVARRQSSGKSACAHVLLHRCAALGFGLTERHRSRTCLASGYDAVLVLKTSWGTGPSRSAADTNQT